MSASWPRSLTAGLLVVVAFALVLVTPAQARSFVLKARGSQTGLGEVRAIGDFKPSRDPSLGAAIDAYGQPTTRRGGGEICRVRWVALGVRITFQNFGGNDSCERDGGLAQKAVVSGDTRWRTARGLHIGNRITRLRALYPQAERTPRGFRLVEGVLPFGAPRRYAVLGARVGSGRVRAFTLFVGAAGD